MTLQENIERLMNDISFEIQTQRSIAGKAMSKSDHLIEMQVKLRDALDSSKPKTEYINPVSATPSPSAPPKPLGESQV